MLTIVTVVKDDPQGLAATCASVDEQVIKQDLEHLIIDGSSSVAACASAPRGINRRIVIDPPRGIYAAMNTGLRSARGEYVWFMNAGDTLAEESTVSFVQELLLADPMWIVGRVRIRNRAGQWNASSTWDFEKEKKNFFARGKFPPHQGTIARTSTMRDLGGFDTRFAIAADYHLALRLSSLAPPLMTDSVLANFTEGGLSTQRWQSAHKEFRAARCAVFDLKGRRALRENLLSAKTYGAEFIHRTVLKADR